MRYTAMHSHLGKVRGSASAHECLHCGGPAREWAYDHTDPAPLVDVLVSRGKPYEVKYSTDVMRYVPLCRPCHRKFDRPSRAECGTAAGFTRHRTAGEAPCDACREDDRARARRYAEEHREAIREQQRARRLDPAYRELLNEKDRQRWRSNPARREGMRVAARKRMEDPEYRERERARIRDYKRLKRAQERAEREQKSKDGLSSTSRSLRPATSKPKEGAS